MTTKNSAQLPRVYFGLHMVPGVAEYTEPSVNDGKPYRILVEEEAIKNMDSTFQGRPLYVKHVEEVDLQNIQQEADGYVVRSFYNATDGKHWAEFIVVSDKGHDAIRNGWKLSNAYIPKEMRGGGQWHGVDFAKEVVRGEYEHLAIVPNPRYSESIILTPEQFKAYNHEKELELKRLSNSKGEKSMFNFFKKQKVENATDLESMSVTLPKSGKEVELSKMINEYDASMMSGDYGYANGDHKVKVGDAVMTVNDLVSKHMELMKSSMGDDEADKDAKTAVAEGEAKKNEEEEEAKKKKENEDKEAAEKAMEEKKKNALFFDELKDAPNKVINDSKTELSESKTARGKTRYGS